MPRIRDWLFAVPKTLVLGDGSHADFWCNEITHLQLRRCERFWNTL